MMWLAHLNRVRGDPESGFSIAELMVAVGIFSSAMLLMTSLMAASLKGILLGKQRTSATTEANALLEKARNLPYDDLGLVTTDSTLVSDPAIVVQSGQRYYRTDDPCNPGTTRLEPIQYASNTAGHVYNPHQWTSTAGQTSITHYVYVTGVDQTCPTPDGVVDHKRVTVRTVFTSHAGAVKNEVRAQTLISKQTPGAPGAPPQNAILPPLSGIALAKGAQAAALVKTGPNACIDATCDPDNLSLALTQSQGTTIVLGSSTVSCTGRTPYLSAKTASLGTSEIASHGQSTSADDDSATANPNAGPNTSTEPYTDLPPLASPLDQYLLEPSVASTTTCSSTAVGLPVESGTSTSGGTVSYWADLSSTGLGVGSLEVLRASGDRSDNSVTQTGATPSAREIALSATRMLANSRALTVSGFGLSASRGLLNVLATDLTASASASGSTPGSAPALNLGTGLDVEVYDHANQIAITECVGRLPGDEYCKIHVDVNQAGFTGKTVTVSVNMGLDATTFPHSYETKIQFHPRRIANGTVTPGGKLYEAQYSPMTATTRLILRVGTPPLYVPEFDSQVNLDLGQVLARGCYGIASGVAGCL